MITYPKETPLSDRVFETIRTIERRKMEELIEPAHALLIREIAREMDIDPAVILAECVKLYRQGRITGGRTVNDRYFKTL